MPVSKEALIRKAIGTALEGAKAQLDQSKYVPTLRVYLRALEEITFQEPSSGEQKKLKFSEAAQEIYCPGGTRPRPELLDEYTQLVQKYDQLTKALNKKIDALISDEIRKLLEERLKEVGASSESNQWKIDFMNKNVILASQSRIKIEEIIPSEGKYHEGLPTGYLDKLNEFKAIEESVAAQKAAEGIRVAERATKCLDEFSQGMSTIYNALVKSINEEKAACTIGRYHAKALDHAQNLIRCLNQIIESYSSKKITQALNTDQVNRLIIECKDKCINAVAVDSAQELFKKDISIVASLANFFIQIGNLIQKTFNNFFNRKAGTPAEEYQSVLTEKFGIFQKAVEGVKPEEPPVAPGPTS